MAFGQTDADEVSAGFGEAGDADAVFALLENRAISLGSTIVSVGQLQLSSPSRLSIICPNGPRDYFNHYVSRRYDQVSPVVAQLRSSLAPFMWSSVHNDRHINPQGQLCMDEARDAGLVDALCVPMHNDHGMLQGWVTFFTDRVNGFDDHTRSALHVLAVAGHTELQRLSGQMVAANQLSLAEREILRALVLGQSTASISSMLGVSTRTIEHHVNAASRKLGTSTRQQTVAAAVRSGQVQSR